jgi:hypothetical protein
MGAGAPSLRPATRVLASVVRGWQTRTMTSCPSAGSWLIVWTSRRRRAAVKPAAPRAGRPFADAEIDGVVYGGLRAQRFPFLVVLLLVVLLGLGVLVVNVQRRDHPIDEDRVRNCPGVVRGLCA